MNLKPLDIRDALGIQKYRLTIEQMVNGHMENINIISDGVVESAMMVAENSQSIAAILKRQQMAQQESYDPVEFRMAGIDLISPQVLCSRLNVYLAKYGYTFGQIAIDGEIQAKWGLVSKSGLNFLSLTYPDMGHAIDAALHLIATGEVPDEL